MKTKIIKFLRMAQYEAFMDLRDAKNKLDPSPADSFGRIYGDRYKTRVERYFQYREETARAEIEELSECINWIEGKSEDG